MSAAEQHRDTASPVASSASWRETPTTSCPASTRRAAATAESTPPLRAARIRANGSDLLGARHDQHDLRGADPELALVGDLGLRDLPFVHERAVRAAEVLEEVPIFPDLDDRVAAGHLVVLYHHVGVAAADHDPGSLARDH